MKHSCHFVRFFGCAALFLGLAATLSGCGVTSDAHGYAGSLAVMGKVHGGAQAVAGAAIQLYAAGTGGNGTAATSLLAQPVYTDASGNFSLTGDFSCPSASTQVYLVARGGNPGLSGEVDNPALVFLSALGNCGALLGGANSTLWVNEVSTVAAVYALAPFMASADHIGASSTNTTGLANAFLNAQLLANLATGQAATLPANLTLEEQKLYGLADVIANCANSDGTTPCARLFAAATPAGGTAPVDTASALLNIVRNPGANVAAVFNQITPAPPFPNTLTQPPNDWTMSLTVTGGGLFQPTAFGLDQAGNVWVANFGGPGVNGQNSTGVVAFSPQGTPFASTPFTNGQMTEVFGLTLDRDNNIWITSQENIAHGSTTGSVAKILGVNSGSPGTFAGMFSDNSLDFPESIASDPASGTVLIANYASSSATVYDLNGNYLNNLAAGQAAHPTGIASDGAGGLWMANEGGTSLTHVLSGGTVQNPGCCYGPYALALDPWGNVWATNSVASAGGTYSFSEVGSDGTPLLSNVSLPDLYTPAGAAIDAAGTFWLLNYHGGSFVAIAGNHNASMAAGTEVNPIPLGRDAGLMEPYKIAPDASGDLWISNSAPNSMVMFFGLATPTATPATPLPVAP